MKTTNLFNISLALACAISILGLSSCNMDLFPEDQISTETYFTSEIELQQYTNYFYRMLPNPETMYAEEGEHFLAPTPSDEMKGIRSLHSGDSYWSSSAWKTLRKVNYYLENSYRCEDAAARAHYDGVAYFFRAYFYFNMLRYFGAVPYYDQAIAADNNEELTKPRDSRDYVINHIIADLDSAIAKLPENHSPYEVNKWTALALKSRACLFEGTFRKYHAGDAFNGGSDVYNETLSGDNLLQLCAEASLELMQNGGYSLYNEGSEPYRDLFASISARDCEMIWARAYSNELDIKNNAQAWSVARQTGFTKRFVNLYPMKSGEAFTSQDGYDKVLYVDEFKDRDPRMAQTIHAPGYIQKGQEKTAAVNLSMTITGYKYIKYIMESNYNNWGSSITCMPIFRLAEVYLNYAEAKAELGTITQADLDMSVNRLRDRVGVGHISLAAAATPDSYLASPDGYGFSNPILASNPNKGIVLEVRRERMIETPLEGLHYWDVMRWKEGHLFTLPRIGMYFPDLGKYDLTGDGKPNVQLATEKKAAGIGVTNMIVDVDIFLTESTKGNMAAYRNQDFVFNEGKDYLYPVPLQERTLTSGKLSQNPGWVDGIEF